MIDGQSSSAETVTRRLGWIDASSSIRTRSAPELAGSYVITDSLRSRDGVSYPNRTSLSLRATISGPLRDARVDRRCETAERVAAASPARLGLHATTELCSP